MISRSGRLLAGTVIPAAAGMAIGAMVSTASTGNAVASPPKAAPLPMAKKRAPGLHLVACNPCNPCAAKTPCAPCSPCAAANPCNPCSPCAAGGGAVSESCFVPRLQAAWASNPCNPCSPCYAGNPCNPCNPCAAKNPCNPCAAANPCNPCAAKNPCAAANPCSPCNPCGAGAAVEITAEEASAVYACLRKEMARDYAKAGVKDVVGYMQWTNVATAPYLSATHGNRYVNNYANKVGAASYAKFEDVGTMPAGSVLAKDSFVVNPNGTVAVGPLFVMAKMAKDSMIDTHDWRYQMIMPSGAIFGTTGGAGSGNVAFCNECHATVAEDHDSLFFLPEEFRASR